MQQVKFKDVAHLYLGCEVQARKKNRNKEWLTGTAVEVTRKSNHGDWVVVNFDEVHCIINAQWNEVCSNFHTYFLSEDEIKPLLRKLDSMTEEESYDLEMLGHHLVICRACSNEFHAARTNYLLSKHFDLFNLIENGEAIDISTVTPLHQINKQ